MRYFQINLQNPQPRAIEEARKVLENGGLIIYPTDTVYGIGCSIYHKKAIEKIYRIKGKSKFEPMSIICESIQQMARFARISNHAFKIIKHCTPGPYTFIMEATREIPRLMLSRRKEVGVRLPDSRVCMSLVKALGHPILNSSVADHDARLFNNPEGILLNYQKCVDVMLDGGQLPDAGESTVVKIDQSEIEIIREGKGNPDKVWY